ncbi:MAG: hypothetical protein ABSF94_13520 [Steroidobacteraceae bacterium]|jgi:hypothetical protein
MKILMLWLIAITVAAGCDARGNARLADVSVIDRDTGVVLTPHYYRGEYWVAGTPGTRYSIEIRNRLGERLLAVTSVDGVNVISGENAAWNQTGYVFDAGERYQVTGWRKSDAEIAAFTFTDASDSYAGRTGRPANIGVIGVALFRERAPQPQSAAERQAPADAADSASADRAIAGAAAGIASRVPAPAPLPVERLGTGHGEREYAWVQHTTFDRLRQQPDEVIRIRYDSLANLEAMGIIARRSPELPRPSPFPGSPAAAYVPDPPG